MFAFSVFQFRIHTGGGEELHSYMDKDILPNEWGGKAGTLDELNGSSKYMFFFINHVNLYRLLILR